VIDALAGLARPWAELYRGSDVLQLLLFAAHVGGVALGGLTALGADRKVVRLAGRPAAQKHAAVEAVRRSHARVVAALAVAIASGLLRLLAHLERLLPSPVLWLKMLGLALLLWNGARLRKQAAALFADPATTDDEWPALKRLALRSVGLWVAVALLGLVLTLAW
jgi:hypothetical protein